MKKLIFIIFSIALTLCLAISCEDTMDPYNPVANVWFKANESQDFILGKIWDKSVDKYIRIVGRSEISIPQSTLLNYNCSCNNLKKITNSSSVLINDLAGSSKNNIWCAASKNENSGIGRVYFFNGETLVNKTPDIFDPKEKNIVSIEYQLFGVTIFKVGKKEHRIFVGESGYVLHYIQKSEGGLEKNPEWHEYFLDGRENLYSVWGTDDFNIWAVGESGAVYKYDENFTWKKLAVPTTETLKDIHGHLADENLSWYAVGTNGSMIYYNGADIEIVADILPTVLGFNAVFMLNDKQGLAVGEKGLVYELTPDSMGWVINADITNLDCFGCFITPNAKNSYISAGNAFNDSGTLFRYYQPIKSE